MQLQGDTLSFNHSGNTFLGASNGAGVFNFYVAKAKMKFNAPPTYASDAAPAADSGLPSVGPYKITGDTALQTNL